MKRDSILNNERQPQEIDIDKLTDRNMVKMEEEDAKEETEIKEPQIEDQGDGVVEMQGLFLKSTQYKKLALNIYKCFVILGFESY